MTRTTADRSGAATTTIRVRRSTKQAMEAIRQPGQTDDALIAAAVEWVRYCQWREAAIAGARRAAEDPDDRAEVQAVLGLLQG